MATNTNNGYRNLFIFSYLCQMQEFDSDTELDENTLLAVLADKLKKVRSTTDDKKIENMFDEYASIAFVDAYKVLLYKESLLSLNNEEKILLDKLRRINSMDELMEMIFKDKFFLEEIFRYILEFNRMTDLQKNLIINRLSNEDIYAMSNETLSIQYDLEEYNYRQDIPVEFITNYYSNDVNKYKEAEIKYDKNEIKFATDKLYEIVNYLKLLSSFNLAVYTSLIEEIIKYNYKWSKYLVDSKFNLPFAYSDSIISQVSMYENISMQGLVENTMYAETYLIDLVNLLILFKCDNLFVDEKVISEDSVNEYIKNLNLNK